VTAAAARRGGSLTICRRFSPWRFGTRGNPVKMNKWLLFQPNFRAFPATSALAFTLAPHLQPINYRGRFSPFGGI
jgi:hypothetical protein